jgi:hypothetical protein
MKEEDENDYITELMVDISLKGSQSKAQNVELCKLYMAYSSGKIITINLT